MVDWLLQPLTLEESAGRGPLPPLRHPDSWAGCFPGSPQLQKEKSSTQTPRSSQCVTIGAQVCTIQFYMNDLHITSYNYIYHPLSQCFSASEDNVAATVAAVFWVAQHMPPPKRLCRWRWPGHIRNTCGIPMAFSCRGHLQDLKVGQIVVGSLGVILDKLLLCWAYVELCQSAVFLARNKCSCNEQSLCCLWFGHCLQLLPVKPQNRTPPSKISQDLQISVWNCGNKDNKAKQPRHFLGNWTVGQQCNRWVSPKGSHRLSVASSWTCSARRASKTIPKMERSDTGRTSLAILKWPLDATEKFLL